MTKTEKKLEELSFQELKAYAKNIGVSAGGNAATIIARIKKVQGQSETSQAPETPETPAVPETPENESEEEDDKTDSVNVVSLDFRGNPTIVRSYNKEQHGPDYKKLAEGFAEKKTRLSGSKCPKTGKLINKIEYQVAKPKKKKKKK